MYITTDDYSEPSLIRNFVVINANFKLGSAGVIVMIALIIIIKTKSQPITSLRVISMRKTEFAEPLDRQFEVQGTEKEND